MGFREKYVQAQEFRQSYCPFSYRCTCNAGTRPEEREFVVDSGASMHTMSKRELSSGEMDTVKRSRTPTVELTANGEVQTHQDAQVFLHDLNLFVAVQLLEEAPAVLSLGKLC